MEDIVKSRLAGKLKNTVQTLKQKNQALDQVTAHCRLDHFSPHQFDQRNVKSLYFSNFSPPKLQTNYNDKITQRQQLQKFRKYDSSTQLLPSIMCSTLYQSSFKGETSPQKSMTIKEKESRILQTNWALNPYSNYQKDFKKKEGLQFNITNKMRPNYNNLKVFDLHQKSAISVYKKEFHPYSYKRENHMATGSKDHLGKQNLCFQTGISEYQRRYESGFETTTPKKQTVSLYKQQSLVTRNKKICQ